MNEDIHIAFAASLADKPAAQDLSGQRAEAFVAQAMVARKAGPFRRKPHLAWAGITFAMAASIAIVLFVASPGTSRSGAGTGADYGVPGQFREDNSVHAAMSVADTTDSASSDTLTVETIIFPEE